MLLGIDKIIEAAVPIVENRIKDIIRGLANEYNVLPTEVLVILKMTDGRDNHMEVFSFCRGKSLKRMELSDIKGGISTVVEKYIAAVFKFDAKRFETSTALVNYKFYLMENGELLGRRTIGGTDYPLLTLKDLLFQKN